MTVYGEWKIAFLNNSVSNTLTNIVDLGRDYDFLNVVMPTLTNCQIACQVAAPSNTDTAITLGEGVNTDWTLGDRASVFAIGGWQYLRLLSSDVQVANRSFKIRGLRY